MLKDKLDQKVRDYRATQTPLEIQQAEMAERVNKDSKYVWEALEKVFIRNCNDHKPLTVVVGICDNKYDPDGTGHVYFTIKDDFLFEKPYKRLVSKKVKYIKETMLAICKIAKSEGIIYEFDDYEPRRASFLIHRTAAWYHFTYIPPKK